MHLVGARGQQVRDFLYDASGTITSGGTAQLVLPEHPVRTSFFIQNLSSANLFVEFGGARASVTISGGALSAFTIANGGFGYTIPPRVKFYGGGDLTKNPTYLCPGLPGYYNSPGAVGSAHALLSGGAVSSIVLDSPGGNYVKAPFVFLQSSEQDPYGVATPSASSGVVLSPSGGSIFYNGTTCPTDAVSIFGASTSQAFTCKYTTGG